MRARETCVSVGLFDCPLSSVSVSVLGFPFPYVDVCVPTFLSFPESTLFFPISFVFVVVMSHRSPESGGPGTLA